MVMNFARRAASNLPVTAVAAVLVAVVPYRVRNPISRAIRGPAVQRTVNRVRYGGVARYCPLCAGHYRKFLSFGVNPRPDAQCPVCGSLERHRLVWSFIAARTDLLESTPRRMLHVAPEPELSRLFRKQPHIDYLTADLLDPDAMVKMDITDIQYPDDSFDVIYCSHVLEHVPDDRRAMRELRRVLRPDGWAILQVPITAEETFEDPSVTDPKERERLFGQFDHVRRYGPDYEDRLREAGFRVRRYDAAEIVGAERLEKLGIDAKDEVFYCTAGDPEAEYDAEQAYERYRTRRRAARTEQMKR